MESVQVMPAVDLRANVLHEYNPMLGPGQHTPHIDLMQFNPTTDKTEAATDFVLVTLFGKTTPVADVARPGNMVFPSNQEGGQLLHAIPNDFDVRGLRMRLLRLPCDAVLVATRLFLVFKVRFNATH